MNDSLRYARHIALPRFGTGGQQRLGKSSALVIGLGGLGSVASLYLANAGIGHLLINDFDRVDASNLPRQLLFRAADVGSFKTDATAARLREANPAVQVSTLNRQLELPALQAAALDCDVVLDCTDNFRTRLLINAACVATRKPLVSGAVIRFEGQVAVFPNQGTGPCYRCLYSDEDENFASCAGQGVLAPVAGTIGTIQASEALKLLLGIESGLRDCLWAYDGLSGATRRVGIRRKTGCPACGNG
ncbi:MAG: HesA/MoeB/ThiF family protein [Gammaproteobacteria bacterium]|nr:HesA/MoeB/ThiF family protein [Gammaproteobacteria bacterium]